MIAKKAQNVRQLFHILPVCALCLDHYQDQIVNMHFDGDCVSVWGVCWSCEVQMDTVGGRVGSLPPWLPLKWTHILTEQPKACPAGSFE